MAENPGKSEAAIIQNSRRSGLGVATALCNEISEHSTNVFFFIYVSDHSRLGRTLYVKYVYAIHFGINMPMRYCRTAYGHAHYVS